MSDRIPYVNHAHRHNPGGSDPLDFPTSAGSGTYRNPVVKYAIGGAEWKVTTIKAASGITYTVDPTAPFGGYAELNGSGKYLVIGAPLGPKGSVWVVTMAYHRSTDGGRLTFEWQTTNVDGLFTGFGYGAGPFPETVEGAETYNTTYYRHNTSATFDQDFYTASPDDLYNTNYSPIVIHGDDGDMLSADGTSVSPDEPYTSAGLPARYMNGGGDGSVMWWLRARVSGQNASSSGFKARIYYLAIQRINMTDGKHIL